MNVYVSIKPLLINSGVRRWVLRGMDQSLCFTRGRVAQLQMATDSYYEVVKLIFVCTSQVWCAKVAVNLEDYSENRNGSPILSERFVLSRTIVVFACN